MLSVLLRKETRLLARLTGWFALIVLLAWLLLQLSGGGWDAAGREGIYVLFFGMVIPTLYSLFAASYLVAGERSARTLTAVCALPVPLPLLWRVKFFSGLAFCIAFTGTLGGMVLQAMQGHLSGDEVLVYAVAMIAIYAVAFLVSCCLRSTLGSMIIGAIAAITCVVSVTWLADELADGIERFQYAARGYTSPHSTFTVISNTENAVAFALYVCLALLATWLGRNYFRTYHSRLLPRLLNLLRGPGMLVGCGLAWLLLLCVVNAPGCTRVSFDADASFATDPVNRDSYRAYVAITDRWTRQLGEVETRRVAKGMAQGYAAAAARPAEYEDVPTEREVVRTRVLRDEVWTDLLTRNTNVQVAADYDSLPRILFLHTLGQIECLDIAGQWRGNRQLAEQKLLRLFRVLNRLSGSGNFTQELLVAGIVRRAAATAQEMYPLTKQQPGGSAGDELVYLITELEAKLPEGMARALTVEGYRSYCQPPWTEEKLAAVSTQTGARMLSTYPFTNPEHLHQLNIAYWLWLAGNARADFWRIDGELGKPHIYRDIIDIVLHPGTVFKSGFQARCDSALFGLALTRSILLRLRCQVLAHRYVRETGNFPSSVAAAYQHAGLVPGLAAACDPLDGNEFVWENIVQKDERGEPLYVDLGVHRQWGE